MRVLIPLVLVWGAAAWCKPDSFNGIFSDQHDGDKKEVTVTGKSVVIKPSGNNQTWTVTTTWDDASCSAIVDFNVPGKPSPPPVNLTLSLWETSRDAATKATFEFFDPSGKVGPADVPLNTWVQLTHSQTGKASCPKDLEAVFQDMHDGDKKHVEVKGSSMIIKPSGNNQTWTVNAKFDQDTCSAVVDFNVPGKPNPPPVNLTLSLWKLNSLYKQPTKKVSFEFTDPSGKLAKPDFPLNTWVQLEDAKPLLV